MKATRHGSMTRGWQGHITTGWVASYESEDGGGQKFEQTLEYDDLVQIDETKYSAVVTGSGLMEDTGWCHAANQMKKSTYRWAVAGRDPSNVSETRPSIIITDLGNSGAGEGTIIEPVLLAVGGHRSVECGSTKDSINMVVGGFDATSADTGTPDTPLPDEDPDPLHLVGSVVYTQARPPYQLYVEPDEYRFTISYDLRRREPAIADTPVAFDDDGAPYELVTGRSKSLLFRVLDNDSGDGLTISTVASSLPGLVVPTGTEIRWTLPNSERPLLGRYEIGYRATDADGNESNEATVRVHLYDCASAAVENRMQDTIHMTWTTSYCFDGTDVWYPAGEPSSGNTAGIVTSDASVDLYKIALQGTWTRSPGPLGLYDPPVATQISEHVWQSEATEQLCIDVTGMVKLPGPAGAATAIQDSIPLLVNAGRLNDEDTQAFLDAFASIGLKACQDQYRARQTWTFSPTGTFTVTGEGTRLLGQSTHFVAVIPDVTASSPDVLYHPPIRLSHDGVGNSSMTGGFQCDIYAETDVCKVVLEERS